MTPTSPRTAAGRALLADLTMGYDPEKGEQTGDIVMPAIYEGMCKDILAIEAEARAGLDVERLARALEALGFQSLETDRDRLIFTEHAAAAIVAALAEPTGGEE